MKSRSLIALAASLSLSLVARAQTAPAARTPESTPPTSIEKPTPSELFATSGGSLLRATQNATATTGSTPKARLAQASLFYVPDPEPKQIKKHDLVTIIIRELTDVSTDAKSDLKKNADLNMSVDEFIRLHPKNFAIGGGAQGATPPKISLKGNRDFKGEGKIDRTDSFVARITAEVVDVKPNGTFAVQARKRIKNDEEEQEFILTGICQAKDITPDGTVLSTQVYDLELIRNTKGAATDTTKRGLVPRLLDFVNPF